MEKDRRRSQDRTVEGETLVAERTPPPSTLAFDADRYRPCLQDLDLSEEQADELLQTLWEIMRTFVDLGFGVDSVQYLFPEVLGQSSGKEARPPRLDGPFVGDSKQNAGGNPGKDDTSD